MASLVAASTAHNPSSSELELLNDVPENIFLAYRSARGNYRYRPLDCQAVLFQCQDLYAPYAAAAWRSPFTRGMEIVEVPGNHVSLLQDPHVKVLGEIIIDLLKQPREQKASRLEPNLGDGRRERAARGAEGLNLEPSVEQSSLS
jgi:thioesterase domain-containing protein